MPTISWRGGWHRDGRITAVGRNGRSHFMTKRFDRTDSGQKIHMQSLCAMEHFDFNRAGENSYEQALLKIRKLGMPMSEVEEHFDAWLSILLHETR